MGGCGPPRRRRYSVFSVAYLPSRIEARSSTLGGRCSTPDRGAVPAVALSAVFMLAQLAWRGEQTTSTSPSMADRSILVLSPVFLVMMLGVTFGAAFSEWEDMRPRLMLRVRAIHVVVVMAATCVAAVPIGGSTAKVSPHVATACSSWGWPCCGQ